MKKLLSLVGAMVLCASAWGQGDVLLLGGITPTTVAAPVAYEQPVVVQAPPVIVQVPVYVQQPAPLYCPPPPCYGASSDIIYVAGPGSCRPPYCAPPNVIYFGRMQACREGYQFRHPR